MTTEVFDVTELVAIVKLAVVAPPATNRAAGTDALEL
jgi:hypothetical protein